MSKKITVSADHTAGMVANIQMGDQKFVIDESGLAEGANTEPDPYDYILSALGACTVITLHMYASRKKWPLERAEVTLSHERVHAKDCEACETKDAKLNHVTKNLTLIGDLSEEQRARLLDISSRCPVQKTLEAGLSVKTNLM
jgi:putative redox protein